MMEETSGQSSTNRSLIGDVLGSNAGVMEYSVKSGGRVENRASVSPIRMKVVLTYYMYALPHS